MREIKFRGKRIATGEWVYGYYTVDANGRHCIWSKDEAFEVDGKTVGQYTGRKDKNGKEIYEGDTYKSRLNTKFPYTIQVVKWSELNQGFEPKMNYPEDSMGHTHLGEVIGDIYSNPELIK